MVVEGQQQALPLQDPRVSLRYPIQYQTCSQPVAGQKQAPPLQVEGEVEGILLSVVWASW